jgi:apolipoprotein N-acyltransferase
MYWLVNVSIPGMIILILVLSLFFGIFGIIAKIIFKYKAEILILPFIWVVLEYIRSYLFTGFPWGLVAYSQYKNMKLMQIADITGAYGISFLVVMFNVGFFAYISRMQRRVTYLMIPLFFMVVSIMYGTYRLENYKQWGSVDISVIQGNIPQKLKWDARHSKNIIAEYSMLTIEAAKDKADLIIWPETAYPYLVEKNRAKEVEKLATETGIPILAGVVYSKNEAFFNSAILFSKEGEYAGRYDKLHLVPFGEYVPFEEKISFVREYIDKPIGNFEEGTEFTLFPIRASTASNTGGMISRQTYFYKLGVLICFEDIFPDLARNFVLHGANFLVNITNDAWFGPTSAAEQHLQASVFRAVENRVPVIRAANTGVSCFIDSTGKVLKRVKMGNRDLFVSGHATESVPISRSKTFYTVYGDAFIYFCGFMLILLFITEFLLQERPSKP